MRIGRYRELNILFITGNFKKSRCRQVAKNDLFVFSFMNVLFSLKLPFVEIPVILIF